MFIILPWLNWPRFKIFAADGLYIILCLNTLLLNTNLLFEINILFCTLKGGGGGGGGSEKVYSLYTCENVDNYEQPLKSIVF